MTQVLGAHQPLGLAPIPARAAVVGGTPLLAHGIAATLEAEHQIVCVAWIPTVEAASASSCQVVATVDVVVLLTDSPSRDASLLLSRLREPVGGEAPAGDEQLPSLHRLSRLHEPVGDDDRAEVHAQPMYHRHRWSHQPPESGATPRTPKLLLLTSNQRRDELIASVQAGAAGYGILEQLAPADLREATLHLLRWGAWLCPVALEKLKDAVTGHLDSWPSRGRSVLSERELEVLRLKALGHRQQQIASTLHIAPCTVKTYIRRSCDKLEVHSYRDAIRVAIDRGLIPDRRS